MLKAGLSLPPRADPDLSQGQNHALLFDTGGADPYHILQYDIGEIDLIRLEAGTITATAAEAGGATTGDVVVIMVGAPSGETGTVTGTEIITLAVVEVEAGVGIELDEGLGLILALPGAGERGLLHLGTGGRKGFREDPEDRGPGRAAEALA
jgi:hypothetical protein